MSSKRINEFNEKASWLRDGVIYHRGKHGNGVKENTLKAFERAIDDKLGIELDVRLTKDEQVIVFHDDNLKRIFNVNKNVAQCTYDEICDITKDLVPLLVDVLKLVNDRVGIMIEIKSAKVGNLEQKVFDILKEYKGRYVIVSFNPFSLKYFKKMDPTIIRGQLSYNFKGSNYNILFKFILRKMLFNIISKPHFISYGIEGCDFKLLEKYHRKGYFIIGWTYKNVKNKEKFSKIYDNMIIEDIDIKEF